jgi:hypothetical protein
MNIKQMLYDLTLKPSVPKWSRKAIVLENVMGYQIG